MVMPRKEDEKIEIIPIDLTIIHKILDMEATMLEIHKTITDVIAHPPMCVYSNNVSTKNK